MIFYVVYDNPSDFPGKFVVRQFADNALSDHSILVKSLPDAVEDTLAAARQKLPVGVVNIGRFQLDDPAIREVWI